MAYDNPNGIIAATVILEVLAVAAVCIRLVARSKRKAKLLADDWLIIASLVVSLGLAIMQIWGCAVKALGVPIMAPVTEASPLERVKTATQLELSYLVLGIFNIGLVKLSVTFLYRRVFAATRTFRNITTAWILVLVAWTITFILVALLECGSHLMVLFGGTAVEYLEYCSAAIPGGKGLVATDVATDFLTLLLPLPIIYKLEMPLNKKMLVTAIFAVGLLSVGAGIGKAYIYIDAVTNLDTKDAIIWITSISVWNLIEVQIGIIAACGPSMQPAFGEGMWWGSRLIQSLKKYASTTALVQKQSEKSSSPRVNISGTDASTRYQLYDIEAGKKITALAKAEAFAPSESDQGSIERCGIHKTTTVSVE